MTAESITPVETARPNGAAAGGGRVCVLVLGMHRSGTSALARTLNLLGCDLPKTLVPEAPGNEAGHWESAPVCKLNDALLDSAGTNWRDFEGVNPDWFRSPKAAEFRARAVADLREEFGESFLFVLKDPRISRIAGWWAETIEASGAAPAIISIVRHPLEVAESLKKRDNFDVALGVLLWLRNTLDAEGQTRGRARAFVSYDELLADWKTAITRAQAALSLAFPKRQSFVTPAIDQFLSDKHRHHRRAPMTGGEGANAWASEAFVILDRWANEGELPADYAALDAIRARLDEAGHAFARLVALQWYQQGQTAKLEKSLADSERKAAEIEVKLADAEKRLRQNSTEINDARSSLAHTESALKQRSLEAEQTAAEVSALKASLADRVTQSAAEIGDLKAELEARFKEIAALTRLVKEREDAITEINQRIRGFNEAGTEIGRLIALRASDTVSFDAEVADIRQNLINREQAYAKLDTLFAERAAEADELRRALSEKAASERADQRQAALRTGAVARAIAVAPLSPAFKGRQFRARMTMLAAAGVFDADWYRGHYKDVAEAGIDPARHYVEFGAKEGRFPCAAVEEASGTRAD